LHTFETIYLVARAAIDAGVSAGELEQLKARITALEALLGIPNEEQHRAYIAAILRGEHDEQYTRLAPFRV